MTALGMKERVISLGKGLAEIPEKLLLAHARGEALFIAGAGISRPANLPDFRELVFEVYAQLDAAVHAAMSAIPRQACNRWNTDLSGLTHQQAAELRRYVAGSQPAHRPFSRGGTVCRFLIISVPAITFKMINDPDIDYTTAPANLMKHLEFMHKVGRLKHLPTSWKDVFLAEPHDLNGNQAR
jgi:hypothetical protein